MLPAPQWHGLQMSRIMFAKWEVNPTNCHLGNIVYHTSHLCLGMMFEGSLDKEGRIGPWYHLRQEVTEFIQIYCWALYICTRCLIILAACVCVSDRAIHVGVLSQHWETERYELVGCYCVLVCWYNIADVVVSWCGSVAVLWRLMFIVLVFWCSVMLLWWCVCVVVLCWRDGVEGMFLRWFTDVESFCSSIFLWCDCMLVMC